MPLFSSLGEAISGWIRDELTKQGGHTWSPFLLAELSAAHP